MGCFGAVLGLVVKVVAQWKAGGVRVDVEETNS
jgi:hypothetical protein